MAVQHPYDEGLWLGTVSALQTLPPAVDTVVSLCRVRDVDVPRGVEHIDVRLIESEDPADNPNLDLVLTDTVRLIELLRGEGRTVLLHLVAARSRTAIVATLYGADKKGVKAETARRKIKRALGDSYPNSEFRRAVTRLAR